jgi:hypothetical protein
MSDKRKPGRHGGPDGQASARRVLRRRWGFRPAGLGAAPEVPERPAHLASAPPNPSPPLARRPAPPAAPPAHRQGPPAGVPGPPPAARRHPSNLDALPHAVPSNPLPQRAARPGAGRPSTAAGEGSIDEITALMDFLRKDDAPGA